MKIQSFEFNMFGEHTYVVYDPESKDAAIIDPGMMDRRETEILFSFITDNCLIAKYLLITHIHVDHTIGINAVLAKYNVKISANKEDSFLGKRIAEQVQMFHLPFEMKGFEIDQYLNDGDKIFLGKHYLEIISVPGHSPGSIALYSAEDGFVITGDAIFKSSIGRTDLPGGDYATLIESITKRLLTLPESTIVYPGHGPSTTIAEEKRTNPYL